MIKKKIPNDFFTSSLSILNQQQLARMKNSREQ